MGRNGGTHYELRGGIPTYESRRNFKKGSDLLVGTSAFLMHRSIQVPSRSAIRWVLVTAWVWRPSHPDLLLRGKSGVRESHLHNRVGLHCIRPECPHVRDALSSIPKKK